MSASKRSATRSLVITASLAGVLGAGCLTRPVAGVKPTRSEIVEETLKQQQVDKVDLLFMIDNSASMGDKQDLLAKAVPDLIDRLLTPNCLTDAQDPGSVVARVNGVCPDGSKEEFPAVYDMHIGVVTSSLGAGGAPDICPETGTGSQNPVPQLSKLDRHNNDKGHLINRKKPDLASPPPGGVEDPVDAAEPLDGTGGDFLAWLPSSNPKNAGRPAPDVTAYTDASQQASLVADFQSLVEGVQEYGCGLEAQLESWYRFLVQPDPWDQITLDPSSGNPPKAQLVGIDTTLLKQRHDFLRDDSLVAVIMVTDEEDSWSDPLSVGGRGWVARTQAYPGSPTGAQAPLPTHECGTVQNGVFVPSSPVVGQESTTGPNDPNCTSCGFVGEKADGTPIASDPSCQTSCGAACTGFYTPDQDNLNVRYTDDMKARYGYSPQFHLQRYIDGLQSPKVPDRDHEPHGGASAPYQPDRNCTNPLFAKGPLPTDPGADLCNLPRGPRSPDLVFFAIIGGVPNQLIEDAQGNLKSQLTAADWQKIVGKDPQDFDLTGIDPHMIESIAPRPGLPGPSDAPTDPIEGREWNTHTSAVGLDLQYACTFDLPTPKDCTTDENKNACDCILNAATAKDGPPLCGSPQSSTQVKGKAYPTIRELRVAKGLGAQGVVASICARNVTDATRPDFGYRPAIRAIVDRLKQVLGGQCLPHPLSRSPQDGTVPCLVLVVFPKDTPPNTACDPAKGLGPVDPEILKRFDEQRLADLREVQPGATEADLGPACELAQLVPDVDFKDTCESSQAAGWCYVEGSPAGECLQAIKFSAGGQPANGTQISLQCIE